MSSSAKTATQASSSAASGGASSQHAEQDTKSSLPIIPWKDNGFAFENKLVGLLHDFDAYRKVWFCQKDEKHSNETKSSAGKGLAVQLFKDTIFQEHVEDPKSASLKHYGTRIVQKMDQKTGRGLLTLFYQARKELKITGNSVKSEHDLSDESSNLWVEVQKRVPWYFRMAPLVGSRLDIGTSAVKNSSADGDSAVLEARNQTGKRAGRKEKEDTEENIWSGEESSGDDEDEEEDDSEEEGESEVEMDDEGGVQDEENEAAEVGGEDGEGKGAEASPEKGGEREKEKKRKGKGKGKVMKTEKVVEDCKPTDHHGAKRTVREDEGSRRRKRTKPLDAVQELMMVRFKADEEKGKDRLVRTTVKAEGDQELEKLKHQTELQKQKTAQLDIDRLKLQLQLAQLQPQL